MLTRLSTVLRLSPKIQNVRHMGGHGVPAHWKPIKQVMIENKNHMDFMPVPAGSWAEYNTAKQATYHKQIAAAATFFLVTYTFLYSQGTLEILHGAPMTNPPPAEWFNADGTWKTD